MHHASDFFYSFIIKSFLYKISKNLKKIWKLMLFISNFVLELFN